MREPPGTDPKSRHPPAPGGAGRPIRLLVPAVMAVAIIFIVIALRWDGSPPPAATRGAESDPALPAPGLDTLLGLWARTDGSYSIEIRGAAPDGMLEARYFNPRPIHVSRAEARIEADRLTLLVELRDRLYPGSYYVLAYDPGADALFGDYHQLGIGERFDVVFNRVHGAVPTPR